MARSAATDLVKQIHDAPLQAVLAVTGGGSRAIAELLETPGGSRTLLEAVVPYSTAALAQWIGGQPAAAAGYCSERTARRMAIAGYRRASQLAAQLAPTPPPLAGISCTASLVTDRQKRGPRRIHVAWQTGGTTCVNSVELQIAARSRGEEEAVAARMILNALAEASGLQARLDPELAPQESVQRERFDAPAVWQDLLAGKAQAVAIHTPPSGSRPADGSTAPRLIFPGAFDPPHAGHQQMADVAAQIVGAPAEFELAVENVDKPPLDFIEIDRRVRALAGSPVWLTRAPTFEEKSRLFPQATFVVGADTIVRIGDPRYYARDPQRMLAAIAAIAERGCRFLVFGRTVEGDFQTLAGLDLPQPLRQICDEVAPSQFRSDISSTDLRQRPDKPG